MRRRLKQLLLLPKSKGMAKPLNSVVLYSTVALIVNVAAVAAYAEDLAIDPVEAEQIELLPAVTSVSSTAAFSPSYVTNERST